MGFIIGHPEAVAINGPEGDLAAASASTTVFLAGPAMAVRTDPTGPTGPTDPIDLTAITTGQAEAAITTTMSAGTIPPYGYGMATGLAIGTYVYSVAPDCVHEQYNGLTYRRCDEVWYQPLYEDAGVRYVVVRRPY